MIFAYDGIFFLIIAIGWPITIALGLLRITRTGWPKELLPKFSFVAHVLVTLSFAAFLFFAAFLHFSSSFDESSPKARTMFLWLFRLSIFATAAAIVGAFRKGPLRWLAPLASFCSIFPWFIQLSFRL